MKCIFLTAPGEILEGKPELEQLGYTVASYPTSQKVEALDDSRYGEFTSFLGYHPEACDKPYVRSLRISFATMLQDSRFADEDLIIFGESDATPTVDAATLHRTLQDLLARHPEADVIRLFHDLSWSAPGEPPPEGDIPFEHFATSWHTSGIPYVWGTHALVVPVAKREKVARVFSSYRLPIDTALEAANGNGELHVLVARYNCFYQKPRTHFVDKTTMYSFRERRMALCLSSYKRFEELQRQIYSMMHQSYDNFHLFVAVKGISTYIFESILVPQFREWIDAGKLTMRWFPNKNQLSNLVDCIRGLDTTGYELFLKIDDDDFYGKDYLRTVNEFHCEIPQHHGSYYCDWGMVHHRNKGFSTIQPEYYYMFGPTLVLPREVMERLLACEETPTLICPVVARATDGVGHQDIGFIEDNFIHKLLCEHGCSNIGPFVHKKGIKHHIIVQKANPSVTRGDLVEGTFRQTNSAVTHNPADYEYVLGLSHREWSDAFCVFGTRGFRVGNGDAATVLAMTPELITLKWDKWGTETFARRADGSYTHQPNQ